MTTNLSGGWLRRNGVPYSARTTLTEYFDRFPGPDRAEWFVVTTIVEDPEYLTGRFVTTSHFRRETDATKWTAPLQAGLKTLALSYRGGRRQIKLPAESGLPEPLYVATSGYGQSGRVREIRPSASTRDARTC